MMERFAVGFPDGGKLHISADRNTKLEAITSPLLIRQALLSWRTGDLIGPNCVGLGVHVRYVLNNYSRFLREYTGL